MVLAALVDFVGCAVQTSYPVKPMFMSDFIVTFVFVYQVIEATHIGKF